LKFKMEIERKFLIKEKTKIYPCPFEIRKLEKEILSKGKKVTQHYIPKKLSKEIFKIFGFKINFIPNNLRIRKIKKDFFITLKSKGNLKREEFERKITKEAFEALKKLKTKTVKKIRLEKKYQKKKIEFDYYPEYLLLIAEIELKSVSKAKRFKTDMKDITGIAKYGNKNLAD